jgi:hypothetical protein
MVIYMSNKICKTCGIEKPDEDFIKADGQHRSTRHRCKECHKEQSNIRKQLRKENPPPESGQCPICKKHTEDWVLDHCHNNGVFRGYICRYCNSGIGLLGDNIEGLVSALNYLLSRK